MRFAIVSDIHANLPAWKAVLIDVRSRDVDKILCLGDIVGYGPYPDAVLESVHANVDYMVLGNHDAVVGGKIDAALFNDSARRIIDWTRSRLNEAAVQFLQSLPLSLAAASFRCAHGDLSQPEAFHYVIDPEDALPSWQTRDEQLLFVGHTHEPALFLLGQSGTPHRVDPQDFVVEAGKRYLVNVGSVGQPRDGEARSCYVIFDSATGTLTWHRVPFDIDTYREALEASGLPSRPSYFLRHDPRAGRPPLRELLNFSPPTDAAQAVQNAVEVQQVEQLEKRVTRWKSVTAALAATALAGAACGGWLWWRQAHRELTLDPPAWVPVSAASFPNAGMGSRDRSPVPERNNLLAVPAAPVPAGQPVEGWRIGLEHRRRQSVSARQSPDGEMHFLLLSSDPRHGLSLTSRPVRVNRGDRFRLYAEFEKSNDYEGTIAVFVQVLHDGRAVDYDWLHNPPDAEQNGWWLARKVFPQTDESLPQGAELSIQVRGKFRGSVRVRRLGLARLEDA